MSSPPIRLPAGVRDFLPRAAARRRSLAARVMDVFEAWGYARIITPVFECADVLERGLGPDARAAAIRFVEPGSGEVVALRPDITPQVARVVATRLADIEGPIRPTRARSPGLRARGPARDPAGRHRARRGGRARGRCGGVAVAAGQCSPHRVAPETWFDCPAHMAPAACARRRARTMRRERDRRARAQGSRGAADRRARPRTFDRAAGGGARLGCGARPEPPAKALGAAVAGGCHPRARAAARGAQPRSRSSRIALRPRHDRSRRSARVRLLHRRTVRGVRGGALDAVLRGRPVRAVGRQWPRRRGPPASRSIRGASRRRRSALQRPRAPHEHGGRRGARRGRGRVRGALRAAGVRAVTAATVPTASWLRGAGFDSAALLDSRELVRADDSRRALDTADVRALVTLLQENPCPS